MHARHCPVRLSHRAALARRPPIHTDVLAGRPAPPPALTEAGSPERGRHSGRSHAAGLHLLTLSRYVLTHSKGLWERPAQARGRLSLLPAAETELDKATDGDCGASPGACPARGAPLAKHETGASRGPRTARQARSRQRAPRSRRRRQPDSAASSSRPGLAARPTPPLPGPAEARGGRSP